MEGTEGVGFTTEGKSDEALSPVSGKFIRLSRQKRGATTFRNYLLEKEPDIAIEAVAERFRYNAKRKLQNKPEEIEAALTLRDSGLLGCAKEGWDLSGRDTLNFSIFSLVSTLIALIIPSTSSEICRMASGFAIAFGIGIGACAIVVACLDATRKRFLDGIELIEKSLPGFGDKTVEAQIGEVIDRCRNWYLAFKKEEARRNR